MDLGLISRLSHEMGVTEARIDRLRRLPFDQARVELDSFKKEVRRNYRTLVFKYHPDRNPQDPDATSKLTWLGKMLKQIDGLQVQRAIPQPVQWFVKVQYVYETANQEPARPAPQYSTAQGSTVRGYGYSAPRVAFVKPV